ncbi:DUF6209 family protein [Pyxidicoccus caerfyrddinensis]|uniref:DUF6209 family protein n=1 Tax=Pyxidicoccus caerfyrddinensis TaxID=2709663 RepID=UPI0013DD5ED9|nr:DUF6209 family protein [Pyxidicoccus caerfyrddinensis]
MLKHSSRWLVATAALLVGTVASSQSTPTITFQSPSQGWNVVASSNPLPFGQTVTINYSADRLTQCRGNITATTPGWSIFGQYSFNGGPVQSFWVAGGYPTPFPPPPSIPLNTRGDLAIWFVNTSRWGCQAWDSSFGNNFHFNVQ